MLFAVSCLIGRLSWTHYSKVLMCRQLSALSFGICIAVSSWHSVSALGMANTFALIRILYCSHCTTNVYLSSCVHLSWSFSISSLHPTAESSQSNNQCGHELLGPGEMLFQMPRWHFSSKAPSKDHWRRMTTWTKPSCCLLMKKLYVWSSPIVKLQERCIENTNPHKDAQNVNIYKEKFNKDSIPIQVIFLASSLDRTDNRVSRCVFSVSVACFLN